MLGPIWSVEMFLYGWRTARVALKRMNRFTAETETPPTRKQLKNTAAPPHNYQTFPHPHNTASPTSTPNPSTSPHKKPLKHSPPSYAPP